MLFYSIILFVVALLFVATGLTIYKGKTDLIHSYHQENVTDKEAYGKAFGKTMFVFAGGMATGGAVALIGKAYEPAAIGILIAGLVAGFVCIGKVQKKYNGGLY